MNKDAKWKTSFSEQFFCLRNHIKTTSHYSKENQFITIEQYESIKTYSGLQHINCVSSVTNGDNGGSSLNGLTTLFTFNKSTTLLLA